MFACCASQFLCVYIQWIIVKMLLRQYDMSVDHIVISGASFCFHVMHHNVLCLCLVPIVIMLLHHCYMSVHHSVLHVVI